MANGNLATDVLLEELDDCIRKLRNTDVNQPSPLCSLHDQAIIALLRCEKHRLMATKRLLFYSTIGSIFSGSVATIIYAVTKAVR